ncbi:TPM domain-containing protein [Kocuria flava]|uniref:TPM domain-containing protein n=1 Tax=Kocuria flava TaxID=446860 RepID=UPI002150E0CB|nr:TPM domain-containing protein [Kocuria flava]
MTWRTTSRRTAAGCGLALALLVPAGAAVAQPPVDVAPGERVVDGSGALEDPSALETEIRQLATEEGVTLYAVTVDSFTSPSDPDRWVQEFADLNGFGSNDAVLAIATEDRQARFDAADGGPLDDAALRAIYQERILPALSAGDWDGAVLGAVEGIGTELSGGAAAGGTDDGGGGGLALLGVGLLGAGGLAAYGFAASRKKRREGAPQRQGTPAGPGGPRSPTRRCRSPSCAGAPARCSSRPTTPSSTPSRSSPSPRCSTAGSRSSPSGGPSRTPSGTCRPPSPSSSSSRTTSPTPSSSSAPG